MNTALCSQLPATFLPPFMHSHPWILCLLFSTTGTGRHIPASFICMQDLCSHPHVHIPVSAYTPDPALAHGITSNSILETGQDTEGPCCSGIQGVWVLLRENVSKIPLAACWGLGITSEVSIGLNCSFPDWVVVMDYIYTSTVPAFHKPSHTSLILEGFNQIFFELGIWDHDYIIFICFSPFTITPPFFFLPVIII